MSIHIADANDGIAVHYDDIADVNHDIAVHFCLFLSFSKEYKYVMHFGRKCSSTASCILLHALQ